MIEITGFVEEIKGGKVLETAREEVPVFSFRLRHEADSYSRELDSYFDCTVFGAEKCRLLNDTIKVGRSMSVHGILHNNTKINVVAFKFFGTEIIVSGEHNI